MRAKRFGRLLAATTVVCGTAALVTMEGRASASGATVTQVSTVTVDPTSPAAIDVGTLNSQFTSITIDATGTTTWCDNFPSPPCTSTADGADNYSFTLGPDATLPGYEVGMLIGRYGVDGEWFPIGSHFVAASDVVTNFYVAYDDDIFFDNSGSYVLTITRVKPAT